MSICQSVCPIVFLTFMYHTEALKPLDKRRCHLAGAPNVWSNTVRQGPPSHHRRLGLGAGNVVKSALQIAAKLLQIGFLL